MGISAASVGLVGMFAGDIGFSDIKRVERVEWVEGGGGGWGWG